jgi:DNA-binding response OmpR family regulator
VVCSVKSSPEDVRRAWLLGCDGYVVKPFDVDVLVTEIRAVLARSVAEREALRAERVQG